MANPLCCLTNIRDGSTHKLERLSYKVNKKKETHNITMLLNVIVPARLLATSDPMKTKNTTCSNLIELRILTQCQYQLSEDGI